jgi:hypothetical protein
MEARPEPPMIPVDHAARVPGGVCCVSCGYLLENLPLPGPCPECGTAIGRSLAGDLLRFSDPRYVKRLRSGARMICNAMLVGLVIVIAQAVAFVMLPLFLLPTGGGAGRGVLTVFVSIAGWLVLGAMLAFLWGWWTLSSPAPGRRPPDGERMRRATRVAAAVAGAMSTLQTLFAYALVPLVTGWRNPAPWIFWTQLGLGLIALASVMGLWIAGMLHLQRLALRIPSRKLWKMAGFRVWFCPVLMVGGGLSVLTFYLACFGVFAPIVAAVLYYTLLNRLGDELTAVVRWMEPTQGSPAPVEG